VVGVTPDVWTDAALTRLQAAGYKVVEVDQSVLPGARAVRRSDLRHTWFLTRLHTFVVLLVVDHATQADLEGLADRAAKWAKSVKGGLPLGFQNGVAVIPVVVCQWADEGARAFAVSKPRKRYATMTLPMVIDPARLFVGTYPRTIWWGIAFQDFLAAQQRIVIGAADAPVLGSHGGRAPVLLYRAGFVFCGIIAVAGVASYFLL
jgi:hypothetical protein